MKIRNLTLLSGLLFLAACSQGNGGGDDSSSIPEKLEFQTQVGAHIADEDFLKSARILKSIGGSMPSTFLLDEFESRAKKQIALNKLSPAYQKYLEKMGEHCTIKKPISQDNKESTPNHNVSDESGEISGPQCPMSYQKHSRSETFVLNSDPNAGTGLAQIHSNSSQHEEALSPQLQSFAKFKVSESATSLEGRFKTDPKLPRLYAKTKINGFLVPVEAEGSKLSIEGSIEMLEKRLSGASDFMQIILQAKIIGGPKDILVSVKAESQDSILLVSIFLNGEKMSKRLVEALEHSEIITSTEPFKVRNDGAIEMSPKSLSRILDDIQTKK